MNAINSPSSTYTCRHYREEMTLLQLERRLQDENLSPEERAVLEKEAAEIRRKMGMD